MGNRSVDEIRGALEHCYTSMEALCADLNDAEWQAQSLCPDWTVRGVFDHIIVRQQLHVAVDGRAARVEHLDHPDVTVTTDSTTFIQLACGRIDPQAQMDSGTISWQGDDELGDRAARNLRFMM